MTFDPLRTGRSNRDRRDQSFARSVIAEATRRHNEVITRATMTPTPIDIDKIDLLDPSGRSLVDTGRCCMSRHQQAVAPWTCDCPCHDREPEPERCAYCNEPLGDDHDAVRCAINQEQS